METRTDAVLMELTAKGDAMAFRSLYGRYEHRIFNFILRLTGQRELAQDMIQETFVRLWATAHLFDPGRGTLKAWLYKMALNIVRTEMRRKVHSQRFVSLDGREASPSLAGDPARDGERRSAERSVRRAVEALPPLLREVVVMKCFESLMFREMSEITGAPEGTLKVRYHRAVAQLKKDFKLEWETA
jgi:RNA polymerase sigma-70 factor (ECF subfamily)